MKDRTRLMDWGLVVATVLWVLALWVFTSPPGVAEQPDTADVRISADSPPDDHPWATVRTITLPEGWTVSEGPLLLVDRNGDAMPAENFSVACYRNMQRALKMALQENPNMAVLREIAEACASGPVDTKTHAPAPPPTR